MELYTVIMNWLNDEPQTGPYMRLEAGYAVLGWRDLQMNAVMARVMSFRNLGLGLMLVIGIPVVLMV